MLKLSSAIVSQPPVVLVSVSMYVPAVLYGLPFQVYGRAFAQTIAFVVSLSNCVMLKFNTAIVSQPPVVPGSVSMYVPAVLYGLPFQVYGSEFAQTVAFVVSLSNCVMLKFSTAIVSQPPVVLLKVSV